MDNIMTEEELEGSASCLICFNKIENYDVLPDQDSQKIIKKCWKYLHENIANSKLQTAKSIDENQQLCCKKCFDAASGLIQLSEHVKNCEKQISDLSFQFSFGVLARRTQVESVNNISDDSPKELIVLDVSRISPSLFAMDPPNPTKTEEFEHPCENSFDETDAVVNVPQYRFEIVKQELNEYFDDNSQLLECPEETTDLHENRLVESEDIEDDVTISKTTRNYPGSRTEMELIANISSQNDDPRSVESIRSETSGTKELPPYTKPVAVLTKEEESDVSDEFNSMSSSLNPSMKHPLRNKSSKKKSGQPTTPSNIILGKTGSGSGNSKKVSISGSSLEVDAIVGNGQRNYYYKCHFCEKVLGKSSDLDRHMRVHTKEKPFKCSVCEKAFSEMSHLNSHNITHTGERPFKCSFCMKAFTDLYGLKRHERSHTGKPFKCSFCVKAFTDLYGLKRHEKIHSKKTFKCSYCGRAFTDLSIAKTHERIHSNEISHLNVRVAK